MRNAIAIAGAGLILAAIFMRKPIMGVIRSISDSGLKFIAQWEGFESEPYKDVAGKWTIGFGHLIRAGENFARITYEQGLELLRSDSKKAARAVASLVRVPISQDQFDALVSLVFNVGEGGFAKSTVLRKLNAGDYRGAADAFRLWNKATIGGKLQTVAGLVNRREAERALFLRGVA